LVAAETKHRLPQTTNGGCICGTVLKRIIIIIVMMMTCSQKNWRTKMEHDKVMIERIKLDVAEWMNTHGQVMMGEEISADVCNIIDESVERTKRIREDWMLPDRS